jgi:hypothetical protein
VNPSLYQLNPRTYLSSIRRDANLDDVPDSLIEWLSRTGFDWLWLVGVWTVGPTSQAISRGNDTWRREFVKTLPDVQDSDICGSPFAVQSYTVDPRLGGEAALAGLRARLARCGIKLLLDFVPNHISFDHEWVSSRPDFLIEGNTTLLTTDPLVWTRVASGRIFAYGRDPNFPGWCDTLQLNYFNPELRNHMKRELLGIASRCDGARCDMAMLLEPEVFRKTWGSAPATRDPDIVPFWPEAIKAVRSEHPKFVFMAEVYWDYEFKLQQHGFDYTYDKTLYDRVLHRDGAYLRSHLIAPSGYQRKMVHFLENHDEDRIASKLSVAEHRAAAALSFLAPGMRFFHDGQLSGNKIRVPIHLSRAPQEKQSPEIVELYDKLIPIIHSPIAKHGTWHLLDTRQAWAGNRTNENFICYLLEHPLGSLLVTANYASYRGQCFVRVPDRAWLDGIVEFHDHLSHERLVRAASDIRERGLFLDSSEWQTHVFKIEHA